MCSVQHRDSKEKGSIGDGVCIVGQHAKPTTDQASCTIAKTRAANIACASPTGVLNAVAYTQFD